MNDILVEVAREYFRAKCAPAFHSEHEGLAMIREKYINLENDIFDIEHERLAALRDMYADIERKIFNSDIFGAPASMRDNAVQLAVMAIKMVHFIDTHPREEKKRNTRFQQNEEHGDFFE